MLPVYQTGIRNGEFITHSSGSTQNKGTVAQISGSYPPSLNGIKDFYCFNPHTVFVICLASYRHL